MVAYGNRVQESPTGTRIRSIQPHSASGFIGSCLTRYPCPVSVPRDLRRGYSYSRGKHDDVSRRLWISFFLLKKGAAAAFQIKIMVQAKVPEM